LDWYKNLLDGGFQDLDGLITDQSTSDTKLQRQGSPNKRKTALSFCRFYVAFLRKTTMGKKAGLRTPRRKTRHRTHFAAGAIRLLFLLKKE
jgi:hypothetical protein